MTKSNSLITFWTFFCWAFFFCGSASAEIIFVQQVFKNIFMVSPHGLEGSNSIFIITDEGVLVVDSGSSPDDARKIIGEIRNHTVKPIKFVINTHYFGTHTFGNKIFRKEGAIIIGHKNVQRALAGKRGQLELERLQKIGIPNLDKEVVVPPNMVFEKRLDIIFGGYQIHLISPGPALTDGDLLVYLPDFKTVIAGGIIGNRVIPNLVASNWENWIKILGRFDNYKAEIILPGSGPAGEKPLALKMRHYILDIKQQIKLQEGKTIKQTLKATLSFLNEKYGGWARQDLMESNIREIYQDLNRSNASE